MPDFGYAAKALLNAPKIVVFTGAGISAESGILTYADPMTGTWAPYDPRNLETAKAFRENPPLIWGWYLWRRQQVAKADPNAAHLAVSRLAKMAHNVSVITQNIDDLHERAGSMDVLHLHGSLSTPKCFACHRPVEIPLPQMTSFIDSEVEPPRCVRCNGKLRPGIVWYGEDLPSDVWKSTVALVKSCDVLISVGTSGIVTPAADIPRLALSSGAIVIHVNTEYVSYGGQNELMLTGKATEVLTKLWSLITIKEQAL